MILKYKLDLFYNGKESAAAQEQAKKQKRKSDYARKRRIKQSILDKDITDENLMK